MYEYLVVGCMIFMLGGDYSIVIGIIFGMVKVICECFGWEIVVIWVDVYVDINIFEGSDSGNVYGMFVFFLIGLLKEDSSN